MALYPPIIASSMPAFDIKQEKVKIYFSLPDYNNATIDKINYVQATVRRQSSNVNVLNSSNGILEIEFNKANYDTQTGLYYITITKDNIKNGFIADVIYKVQLRFKSGIENTIQQYSQWSTVCIIKPINAPNFYIDEFYYKEQEYDKDDVNIFSYELADFTGVYEQENSSQTLKSWRIRLYNRENNQLLADSNWNLISANNYNIDTSSVVFECALSAKLENQKQYKLRLDIETKNGYTQYHIYNFNTNILSGEELLGTISAAVNEEEGYIKFQYTPSEEEQQYIGNLVIRRTSAESNFTDWEDLKNFFVTGIEDTITYYDFTAESGMAYKYLIQKRNSRGRRGNPLISSIIIAEWQHAFLLEANNSSSLDTIKQLKLKFDFQISSYKTNISQSRTDTIGSKYPFIRRNGQMYYRSFSCTGTVTSYMDNTDLFTSSEQMFQNYLKDYNDYKGNYDYYVNKYDYTYERKFREKVQEFLYNAKPKLYKSMQEGNMIVKLMEVSQTPKNELGRLIYSFSATLYQIDQLTINNLNKHSFINIGTYNPNITSLENNVLGQLTSYTDDEKLFSTYFAAGKDIIGTDRATAANNSIASANNYNRPIQGQVVTGFNIRWLRLTIESQPYLIGYDSSETDPVFKWKPIENINNINMNYPIIEQPLYQIRSVANSNNGDSRTVYYLGTLFNATINGERSQIIISYPNNIYEIGRDSADSFFNLSSSNTSIVPAKDTLMSVDYVIDLIKEKDTSNESIMTRNENVNSYLEGVSDNTDIVKTIQIKHNDQYYNSSGRRIKQIVQGIQSIEIEAEPFTVVEIKIDDNEKQQITLNETGVRKFDLHTTSSLITQFRILGVKNNDEYIPVDYLLYYLANIRRDYYESTYIS